MKRKAGCFMLLLSIMLLVSLAATADEWTVRTGGLTCTYTKDETGLVLRIQGTGTIQHLSREPGLREIIIEDGVTGIGDNAFQ